MINLSKNFFHVAIFLIISFSLVAPALAQNIRMGTTYSAFDSQIESLTTVWPDAAAITERTPDGTLVTNIISRDDRETLQVYIDKDGQVAFQDHRFKEIHITRQPTDIDVTTDWVNLQAYALWKDLRKLPPSATPYLSWRGDFLRSETLIPEKEGISFVQEMIASIDTVEAVFPEVIASSMKVPATPEKASSKGQDKSTYATFSTTVADRQTGEPIGGALWFESTRVYSWNFGTITSGWLSDDRVPGGIPFNPNLSWSNIQSYAFWKLHSELQKSHQLTTKNTVGCDGLHWLDNTIFRPCCDDHDRCYEKYGCTYKSWWFQGSWRCIGCNIGAVFCFTTAGIFSDACHICCGDPCPSQCLVCRPKTTCPV